MVDRVQALGTTILIGVGNQGETLLVRKRIAEVDKRLKFPGCIDMQKGSRRLRGKEGTKCQTGKDGGVLARRKQHHRVSCPGDTLAQYEDRLGFRSFEVSEGVIGNRPS